MSEHQPLPTLWNFAIIGAYILTRLWLATAGPHPCVHTNTHTLINTFKCTICFSCPTLSCLAGIISNCRAKGSKVTTAWQSKLRVLPLFSECVSVCCQRDSMTSLIKFALPEFSFMYIQYNIHGLYMQPCLCSPPVLANSSFPPLLLASPLLLFFWFPPNTSHSVHGFWISPSLCPLGTDWQDRVSLIVHTSHWDSYCGIVEPTECCTVWMQPSRGQCPISTLCKSLLLWNYKLNSLALMNCYFYVFILIEIVHLLFFRYMTSMLW